MREDHEFIERWVRRGRKAVVLQRDASGEQIVLRDGRRSMPVGYAPVPATFDGRARMNVQNLLAAAACHVSGAHLHDIELGLRTFTTDFFQAPGRLNLVDLGGHGAARLRAQRGGVADRGGLRRADDVGAAAGPPGEPSWSANLRVAVVATAGDRRDEDMRELGRVAAATSTR